MLVCLLTYEAACKADIAPTLSLPRWRGRGDDALGARVWLNRAKVWRRVTLLVPPSRHR